MSPSIPRSDKGRKTWSWPLDCSVKAAHTRNSNTWPDALASWCVQGPGIAGDCMLVPSQCTSLGVSPVRKRETPPRQFETRDDCSVDYLGIEVGLASDHATGP